MFAIYLGLVLVFHLLPHFPLDDAEDVDPEQAAGPHVHHPQVCWHQQKVDSLGWKPKEARALESWQELLSEQKS